MAEKTPGTDPEERGEADAGAARALAPVKRVLDSKRAPRIRSWVALLLVVASALAILMSALALWSRSVVFDTDPWVTAVTPLAEDSQARDAVSRYIAAKALEITDLSARIADALPSDAELLAALPAANPEGFLVEEVDTFLDTELAQRLWADSNRLAHEQLLAAPRDDSRNVTVGRNDVKLNLLPIIAIALQRLEVKLPQLLGRDVTLLPIDPATAPDDIHTLLQDALGRELPADIGSVTLLEGNQAYEAKRTLGRLTDLAVPLVVLTIVLIGAALLVSVRRRRTALWLGLGALIGVVAARVIEGQAEEAAAVVVATSQDGAAVAKSIVSSVIGSLHPFFVWIAVAGVIVAVAAILAGRPAWLDAMSRGFAGLLGIAADLSAPDTRAKRWTATHLDLLRVAGIAVALVVLLFTTGSLVAALAVVAALVVYELALGAYATAVAREPGDGADGPSRPPA